MSLNTIVDGNAIHTQSEHPTTAPGMSDGPLYNGTSSSNLSYFHVIYYVVDVILAVLAIAGNLLIVLAFINNRRLRIVSHYHLISLAISDLLMGALTIPIWLAAAFQGLPHSSRQCILGLSTVLFVDLASVFSLFLMTVDRYLFICWPLYYNTSVTHRKALIWIISSWGLAGVFVIPMFFTWRWTPTQTHCHLMTVVDTQYLFSIFIMCILMPIMVMSVMYGHVFAIIRQKKQEDKAMYSMSIRLKQSASTDDLDRIETEEDRVDRRPTIDSIRKQSVHSIVDALRGVVIKSRFNHSELHTAMFFAFLLLFFVVTWVPMFVLEIFVYLGYPVSQDGLNVAVLLSHCNSSFNPLLYRYRSDFGQTVFLWACTRRKQDHYNGNSTPPEMEGR